VTPLNIGPTRFAAVDIGTNSVLLLVVEQCNGSLRSVVDRAVITRLGRGVDQARQLAPDAVEHTLDCLRQYSSELNLLHVRSPLVVGTSALRDASGAESFLDEAECILGSRPQIISGTEEAELSFRGAISGLNLGGSATVFDVGGGSTEIIEGVAHPCAPLFRDTMSIDVGAVRLYERHARHDPPLPEELRAIRHEVGHHLADSTRFRNSSSVGVGGTVTTIISMLKQLEPYDGSQVHGARLKQDEVERLLSELAEKSEAQRRALPGLEARRADVIVAGVAIVLEVMNWLCSKEIVVSDRGLRWGLVERAASQSP